MADAIGGKPDRRHDQYPVGSESGREFTTLCGFQIRGAALTAVEVESPTRVRIRLAKPLPTGAPCAISYGVPHAGALGVVAAIRAGPAAHGGPTTELLVKGSVTGAMKSLLAEGAFYATSMTGNVYAQATIRFVQEENTHTVLRYENRELRNDTPFAVGQTLTAMRVFPYGNLRDSDATPSQNGYPLHDWCVHFDEAVP